MKMVILGAGASYDCIHKYFDKSIESEWRPPLGAELFDTRANFKEIFDKYSGLQMLYSQINAANDIEEYFQNKWDFAQKHQSREIFSSLFSIQYAIQELMITISRKYKDIGLNNYDILLNQAFEYSKDKNEDVIFVTFNYDLLLEYSLRKIYPDNGKSSGDLLLEEYIRFPLKIFKMHGSCNWFRKIIPGFINDNDFGPANYIYRKQPLFDELKKFLDEEIIVRDNSTRIFGIYDNEYEYFFPELLIPFKSKDSFILPKFHQSCLEKTISKVDSILIIGWKGNEESFLQLLSEKLGNKAIEIFSVNGENMQIQDDLKKHLPKARFTLFSADYNVPPYSPNGIYDQYFASPVIATNPNYRFRKGSFSSYILRTEKQMEQSFFKL